MEKSNPVMSIMNSILVLALVLVAAVAGAYFAGITVGLVIEAFDAGLSLTQ